MDLRHLRYFIAAVEEGSLQAASQRSNISQPALSRRIHDIEDELGCKLLIRSSKGVSATPAGTELYRKAIGVIEDFEDARESAQRIGRGHTSVARLGFVPTCRKLRFLQEAVGAFCRSHSASALSAIRGTSHAMEADLRAGRFDIAVFYERRIASGDLHERPIHRERYVMALHPDHPLALKKPARLADFAGTALVWLSRREYAQGQDSLMQQCKLHGFEPLVGQFASDIEEQFDLVSLTGGACLTPAFNAALAPPGMLTFRPLPDFGTEMNLTLAWTNELGPSARALLGELHTAIDQHQAGIVEDLLPEAHLLGHRVVRMPEESGLRYI